MAADPHAGLSRRERQIMNIIYRAGQATAQDVRDRLEDPPSYSAVRSHLRILEEKKHLRHRWDGPRHLFEPTVPRERARRSALKSLLRNFFDDSYEDMFAALLENSAGELSDAELKKLARMIEMARKEGR